MDDDDLLEPLAGWLNGRRDAISSQVTVRKDRGAYGLRSTVAIDHRLLCDLDAHTGWRVSTQPTFLSQHQFSSLACHYLKTADAGRGRAIYCHDLSAGEVVAAISYHLDQKPSLPVLVTMIGLRTDSGQSAFLRDRTLAGALVTKHYIHAIADKAGRGGYVDLDLAERKHEAITQLLGFRRAPRVKGFRPGGSHLRQPAPPS
jgi:hypothetical protein